MNFLLSWTSQKKKYHNSTVMTLSVSSSKKSCDCASIVDRLAQSGCVEDVKAVSTWSATSQQPAAPGCDVTIVAPPANISTIWNVLKSSHPEFQCGHLTIPGLFVGCIHDFFAPTRCPHRAHENPEQN